MIFNKRLIIEKLTRYKYTAENVLTISISFKAINSLILFYYNITTIPNEYRK